MKTLSWNQTRSLEGAAIRAGRAPGIYLIGSISERLGIPMSYEWVYVGRSNRLSRRLIEHLPENEVNPFLLNWIKNIGEDLVVRFAVVPDDETVEVEKTLVRALAPQHNRIMFNTEK